MSRSRRSLGALAMLGMGALGLVGGCLDPSVTSPPQTPTTAAARVTPLPPPPSPSVPQAPPTPWTAGPVLAAKVDNTAGARPRIGVSVADVVYVEPVEAGLTRLLAVFASRMPPRIGPVRSARESDLDLLGNYGRVAFAYSGGSAATVDRLRTGRQIDLSYDASRTGYQRVADRPAPYNIVGDPSVLLSRAGGSAPPGPVGFFFGPTPPAGAPGGSLATAYERARVSFDWDPQRQRYVVGVDGAPDLDADGSPHLAGTVVVQRVVTRPSDNRDVNGIPTPRIDVLGEGDALVLRDGLSFPVRWRRTDQAGPTTFTRDGVTIPFATTPIWVVLVPLGQGVSVR